MKTILEMLRVHYLGYFYVSFNQFFFKMFLLFILKFQTVSDSCVDNNAFGHRNHNKNVDIKFSAHNAFLE